MNPQRPTLSETRKFILPLALGVWAVGLALYRFDFWEAVMLKLAVASGLVAVTAMFVPSQGTRSALFDRIALALSVATFSVWTVLAQLIPLDKTDFAIILVCYISLAAWYMKKWRVHWAVPVLLPWFALTTRYLSMNAVPHSGTPIVVTDSSRFRPLRRDASYPSLSIGVALSGGGYRAALYHAGVLDALEELHLTPSVLTSVSGGSIIGAYYAMGGAPREFRDVVESHRLNLKRELLLFHNAVRLPFPFSIPGTKMALFPWYSFSKADAEANQLDRVLFGGAKMSSLSKAGAPRLMICATDLRSGRQDAFGSDGFLSYRSIGGYHEKDLWEGLPFLMQPSDMEGDFPKNRRISEIVTASGAFPLAFPSVEIATHFKDRKQEDAEAFQMHLADGGITDNTGLTVMRLLEVDTQGDRDLVGQRSEDWKVDLILASDVTPVLSNHDQSGAISDIGRTVDLIYAQVSPEPEQLFKTDLDGQQRRTEQPKTIRLAAQDMLSRRNGPFGGGGTSYVVSGASVGLLVDSSLIEKKVKLLTDGEFALLLRDCDSDCRKAAIASRHNDPHGDERLANDVASRLASDLTVFNRADTLRDFYDSSEAEALFELGRLRAILEAGSIREALSERSHTGRP